MNFIEEMMGWGGGRECTGEGKGGFGTVKSNPSKYRTFYFDKFPDA